ncbi:hypothetical protein FPZ12_003270 [Amycolatopsis acidicola]|uniref:Uncharacterized protein n=1 Tax=Amycolatopsis acidicola TaxID=2596893 RepID=A0A5N0VIA9_9PSEU|nr:hypothetical protein [Amycolatopsis acidicola]KAA9165986.1 hypothetical protein FPZ12_003270 [Amycolatopsis acidicola]
MNALPFFVLAAVLSGLAWWGGRQSWDSLVFSDPRQREHKQRVLRRGVRACWTLAAAFALFAAAALIASLAA